MKFLRKSLSAFLVLCMLVSTLPISAVAAPDMRGVMLDSFTVSIDGGNPVSLLSSGSSLNLELGESYTFALRFNHPDEVRNAYVVSEKDNEKRYLEATNNGTGIFVTSGYFGGDRSYVPGTLSVEFSKTGKPLQEDIIWSSLQSPLNQNDVTITTNTVESVRGTANVSDLLKDGAETVLDFSVDAFNTLSGADVDLGVYKDLFSTIKDLEKGEVYCITPDENWYEPGTYVAFLKDASDANKFVRMVLDVKDDYPDTPPSNTLSKISEDLSTYSDVISLMADFVDIQDEKEKLVEQIEKSTLIQNKDEALNKLDSYVRDRQIFSMIVTLLPAVALASGGTMVMPALLIKYYFKAMEKSADYFWDYRVGMIQGCDPIEGSFSNSSGGGSGGTAITNKFLEENEVITRSGNYYLAEDILVPVEEDRSDIIIGERLYPTKVDATIDLNGHSCIGIWVYGGSTVRIYDSKYKETEDYLNNGGKANQIAISSRENQVSISHCIVENLGIGRASNLTISNSIVKGRLEIGDKSVVTITDSICSSSISNSDSILNISGGHIAGISCIKDAIINIDDATIDKVSNPSGTININSGIINEIHNQGKMVISGTAKTIGSITNDGDGDLTISGGEISSQGTTICNNSNGKLTITGGTIESTFESATSGGLTACLSINGGNVAINGGTIQSFGNIPGIRFSGLNDGTLSINGGTISGENGVDWLRGCVKITNGKIIGKKSGLNFGGQWGPELDLAVQSNSTIEISGSRNAINTFAGSKFSGIRATNGYMDGITYYNAPNAQGVKMTIQEAANIDFKQPYVRLVADGVSTGPSGGDQEDCTHDYTSTVTAPTCTERGYTMHTCTKCGHSYQDNYVNALGHSFGGWVVIREATSTTNGSRERTCTVCNYKETGTIPATGSSGGGSGSSGSGSSSSSDSSSSKPDREPSTSSGYQISSSKDVTGGRVNLSRANAVTGQAVTVVVHPDDGYELDTLKVLDSSGKELSLRKQNGRYVFIMPDGKVSVEATFRPIGQATNDTQTPNADFSDIPNGYWAEDAINWTRSNGYMNGITDSTFNPEGTITRQQLCMILSRLSGQSPSGMAEARIWAMNSGLTDGTKSGAPATRQQMVTFLYRYCRMMNYPITSGGDLTAFPDYASASNYARETLAWAVGNGIITGTKAGKLNPGGTATRAQFAVILQRFTKTIAEG